MTDFSQQTNPWSVSDPVSDYSSLAEFSQVTIGDESAVPPLFTGDPDPIRQAREIIKQVDNPSVILQAERLLSTIQRMIQLIKESRPEVKDIPPLHVEFDGENESLLISWVFRDFRVGFNIELNEYESGWHLVTNKNLGDIAASGQLLDIGNIVAVLINFILSNI
jgi:hypothetical protein